MAQIIQPEQLISPSLVGESASDLRDGRDAGRAVTGRPHSRCRPLICRQQRVESGTAHATCGPDSAKLIVLPAQELV